jgi:hypothetical protein
MTQEGFLSALNLLNRDLEKWISHPRENSSKTTYKDPGEIEIIFFQEFLNSDLAK